MRRWIPALTLLLALLAPRYLGAQQQFFRTFILSNSTQCPLTTAQILEFAKFDLVSNSAGTSGCFAGGGRTGWNNLKFLHNQLYGRNDLRIIAYYNGPALYGFSLSPMPGNPVECPDQGTCVNFIRSQHGMGATDANRWMDRGIVANPNGATTPIGLMGGTGFGYEDSNLMRPGNINWLNQWIGAAVGYITNNWFPPNFDGLTGYFHDDSDWTKAVSYGSNLTIYEIPFFDQEPYHDWPDDYFDAPGPCDAVCNNKFRADMKLWMNTYDPIAASNGLENVHNFQHIGASAADYIEMDQLTSPPFGVYDEGSIWRTSPISNGGTSAGLWKTSVDAIVASTQHQKYFPQCWDWNSSIDGTQTNEQIMQMTSTGGGWEFKRALWYCMGTLLLAYEPSRENIYFMFMVINNPAGQYNAYAHFWDEFDPTKLHLGRPVGAYVHVQDQCLFRREYDDAWVFVNACNAFYAGIAVPSGNARRIEHDQLLTANTETLTTSFSLGGFRSVILLKEGRNITNADNSGASPVQITTIALGAGQVGVAYNQTIACVGGTAPRTFALTSGSLPTGLSLNTSTGAITGTPSTATGSPFAFTVTCTDAVAATDPQTYSVTIAPAAASGSALTMATIANPLSVSDAFTTAIAAQCLDAYSSNWTLVYDGGAAAGLIDQDRIFLPRTPRTPSNCVMVDPATDRIFGNGPSFVGWSARRTENYLNDHSGTITISALAADGSGGTQFPGVGCRVQGSGGTHSGYYSVTYKGTTDQSTALVKFTAGTFQTLAASALITWAPTETITTDCSGNTITTRRNGSTILSYVDPAPLSGGSPGVLMAGGSGTVAAADDFIGTGIIGPGVTGFQRPNPQVPLRWSYKTVSGTVSLRYSLQGASGYYYPIADVAVGSTAGGACNPNPGDDGCGTYVWTANVPTSATVVVCVEQDAADCGGTLKSVSDAFSVTGEYLR